MTKRMNMTKRWTMFCNAWVSIYCCAVEGHRETMRMLYTDE